MINSLNYCSTTALWIWTAQQLMMSFMEIITILYFKNKYKLTAKYTRIATSAIAMMSHWVSWPTDSRSLSTHVMAV